jgi:HAD superfamily hydrolase (TIGR01549 family)
VDPAAGKTAFACAMGSCTGPYARPMVDPVRDLAIFDLDGTLIDSDDALLAPFLELGVRREDITFGRVLEDECDRLGISVDEYLAAYDPTTAQPYRGVEDMLAKLGRWAVASNKHPIGGKAELARLGWHPEVAMFTDAFGGPKSLGPVLDALDVSADQVIYVGDTEHDRRVAVDAGVPFGLAAWNPRARSEPGDVVLETPEDVLALLGVG